MCKYVPLHLWYALHIFDLISTGQQREVESVNGWLVLVSDTRTYVRVANLLMSFVIIIS